MISKVKSKDSFDFEVHNFLVRVCLACFSCLSDLGRADRKCSHECTPHHGPSAHGRLTNLNRSPPGDNRISSPSNRTESDRSRDQCCPRSKVWTYFGRW